MTVPLVRTSREAIKANLIKAARELNRLSAAAYAASNSDLPETEQNHAEARLQTAKERVFGMECLLIDAFGIITRHNFTHFRPYERIYALTIKWNPHEAAEVVPVE